MDNEINEWSLAAADGRCALITHNKDKPTQPKNSIVSFIQSFIPQLNFFGLV